MVAAAMAPEDLSICDMRAECSDRARSSKVQKQIGEFVETVALILTFFPREKEQCLDVSGLRVAVRQVQSQVIG